jgi:hypothetical protein
MDLPLVIAHNGSERVAQRGVMGRRIRKLILTTVLILVLLLSLLVIGIHLPFAQDYVAARLLALLERELGTRVECRRLRYSLFGWVEVDGFRIAAPEGRPAPDFLRVERVRVRFNPPRLLSGTLVLDAVEVTEPVVQIVIEEDGWSNTPPGSGRRPAAEHRSPPDPEQVARAIMLVRTKALQLLDGRLLLRVAEDDLELEAPRLSLVGELADSGDSYELMLRCPLVELRVAKAIALQAELSLLAQADGAGAEIRQFFLEAAGGGVRLYSTRGSVRDYASPKLDIDAVLAAGIEDVFSTLPEAEAEITGDVEITGRVWGPAVDLSAEGALRGTKALVYGQPIRSWKADWRFRGTELTLDPVELLAVGGRIAGAVDLRFGGEESGLAAEATLEDLDLGALLRANEVPVSELPVTISGRATYRLPGFVAEEGQGSVDAALHDASPLLPLTGTVPLEIAGATLKVTGATVHLGEEGSLYADFRLDPDGRMALDAAFALENDALWERLTRVFPDPLAELPAPGWSRAEGRFSLSGAVTSPRLQAAVTVSEPRFAGMAGQSLQGVLELADTRLSVNDLDLAVAGGRVRGSLALDTEKAGAETGLPSRVTAPALLRVVPLEQAHLELNDLDLAALGRMFAMEELGAGRISGRLDLGPGDAGERRLEATLEAAGAAFGPLADLDLTTSWSLAPDGGAARLRLGRSGRAPGALLDATCNLSATGALAGSARLGPLPVSMIVTAFPEAPLSGGVLTGKLELGGTTELPEWRLTLHSRDLSLSEQPLRDLDLQASGGLATAQGELTDPEGRLRARIDWSAESGLHIAAGLNGWRLDPGLAAWIGLPEELQVQAAGNIDWRLAPDQPAPGTLELVLDDLRARYGEWELAVENGLEAGYREGALHLAPTRITDGRSTMTLALELDDQGGLEGSAEGAIDLGAFGGLIPGIEDLKGTAQTDLQLAGSTSRPRLEGFAQIAGASVRIPDLNLTVEDIEAGIRLEPNLVALDYFGGVTAEGQVLAGGELTLAGLSPRYLDLWLDAGRVELRMIKGLQGFADAELTCTGPLDRLVLGGDVYLTETEYRGRVDYRSLIVEESKAVLSFRSRLFEPVEDTTAEAGGPALNIRVRTRDNVRIKNNLADLELSADLLVQGTTANIQLFGRMEALEGRIVYGGRSFELESATMDFVDPLSIDPYVELRASAEVSGYLLRLALDGRLLGQFTVQLSSEPPLNDIDLWALLALGRTTEQMSDAGGSYTATEAASILTGQIQDEIEKRMTMLGGFDEVMINPIYSDTNASAAARFTVKKRLGERLSVTYSTDIASSGQQLMFIEYRLNDRLVLVGERTEDGSVGADIRFHLEFP